MTTAEPFDVDVARADMAGEIAAGLYANVVLVDKASADGNAPHGVNAVEEVDGA
jgi:hypothetical protein